MAIELTKETFEAEVLKSETPVLVDFWAPWCGPCKMVAPVLEELSEQAKGYKIAKLDVDTAPEIAQTYGIMSIPTIILFNKGEVAEQVVGVQTKEALEALVQSVL